MTDLVLPVKDKANGKWRIVALHIESDNTSYFGMITEDSYESQSEAAILAIAMQTELKKTFEANNPEQPMINRKQRRAMMSGARKNG